MSGGPSTGSNRAGCTVKLDMVEAEAKRREGEDKLKAEKRAQRYEM